jgi:hypothetical protein
MWAKIATVTESLGLGKEEHRPDVQNFYVLSRSDRCWFSIVLGRMILLAGILHYLWHCACTDPFAFADSSAAAFIAAVYVFVHISRVFSTAWMYAVTLLVHNSILSGQ